MAGKSMLWLPLELGSMSYGRKGCVLVFFGNWTLKCTNMVGLFGGCFKDVPNLDKAEEDKVYDLWKAFLHSISEIIVKPWSLC